MNVPVLLLRPAHHRSARRGFTLVELLIVIMIIVILASIVMFSMAGVVEKAKADRTQAQIFRLNALIAERWEAYQTRRVPVPIQNASPSTAALDTARMRLYGLRELMRMELPDRKTDVETNSALVPPIPEPSLLRSYRRRVDGLDGADALDGIPVAADYNKWTVQHQGAECLYLIVAHIQDGYSRGLEFFKEDEIGDVDSDGMPEILDGWGNPIEFLRWAPGFLAPYSSIQDGLVANGTDAFDPRQVDQRYPSNAGQLYLLYPLIFSAGPDAKYEISTDTDPVALTYATDTNPPNDPYHNPASGKLGSWVDANSDGVKDFFDNIHNHSIEAN